MKLLLVALNAKFIHSSLALRCLKKYAQEFEEHIFISEYTINHQEDFIISDIYKQKPDAVFFSCYIWNISMICNIAATLRKLIPDLLIVFGGPEVSYEANTVLKENDCVDIIIRGEGEKTFQEIVSMIVLKNIQLKNIDGITYQEEGHIYSNNDRKPICLDELPFVYEEVSTLDHKIIYYETQRGCPFQCQYCLSSIEKEVRFLSEDRVKSDLQFFIDHTVAQVKFVDRTFNCNKEHANMIWRYLIEHDNGITNFHMEITAELLEKETLSMLKNARPGLFQFEIGVQSTNQQTLTAIKRHHNFKDLKCIVDEIKSFKNIHQHLDLIAGLPFENYESFRQSFNDVYGLLPEQFQLGFLKLLKGSGLKRDAQKLGIVYHDTAPYEVLYTRELPFEDVLKLKRIEELVELYYNSGKALNTLHYAIQFYSSPFDFFESFGDYWEKKGHFLVQHNKMELYTIFFEYSKADSLLQSVLEEIRNLLKLDMLLCDCVKTVPYWLNEEDDEIWKKRKKAFYQRKENISYYLPELLKYEPRQLARMCPIVLFDIDVTALLENGKSTVERVKTPILFHYNAKESIYNHTAFYRLEL